MDRPDAELQHRSSPPADEEVAPERRSRSSEGLDGDVANLGETVEIETLDAARRTVSVREPRRVAPPRCVAVLGCSAGGLPALQGFFAAIGPHSGTSMVLLAHASPDFESLLPGLLQTGSTVPLRTAADGDRLLEDDVLVVPPGHDASFDADGLRLRLRPRDGRPAPAGAPGPIDAALGSLAAVHGERSLALILSGTGDDGAIGVERVADAGGTVIVQSPESCEFPGMPRAATATGRADHVLPPDEAARVVTGLGSRELVARRLSAAADGDTQDSVLAVIRELVEADELYGLDHFDGRMLARRILHRLILLDITTPEEYAERLRWDVEERGRLLEAMIDGETGFFRDRDSWRTLQELVVRRLVAEGGPEPIRAWVVGCSTGEDAYCLALQFEEEMRRADRRVPYTVFATDLMSERIERASAGRFAAADVANLPPSMITRGFHVSGDTATAVPSLRRQLAFARHDVRTDPAFTRLDLVVCRGVLPTFDERGRRDALMRVVHGLRPRGVLFLGGDEPIGGPVAGLQPLHGPSGLYTRRPGDGGACTRSPGAPSAGAAMAGHRGRRPREHALASALEAVLGEHRGRMCLLLGTDGQLLHAFGDTRRYLAVKPGVLQTRVPDLLVAPLRTTVEAAMVRALRTGAPVTLQAVLADPLRASADCAVEVTVAPVEGDGSEERQLSLVVQAVGEDSRGAGGTDGGGDGGDDGGDIAAGAARVAALESELARTRASVRELGDELAATLRQRAALADELKDTARRAHENHAELMSVNQELYTVNREHEAKIRELVQLNNDMENLLRTAQIGTVFLDRDLRIRRRTPAANILFRHDVESSAELEDVRLPSGVAPFAPDLQRVLREAVTIERQMRLDDGRDYLMYLHPYRRKDDGQLDGVVITVVDVTDLKRAEFQLRRLNTELRNRNQEAEAFAHTVSHDLKSPLVTIGCMMGLLRESLAGHPDPEPIRYVGQTESTVQAMRQTIDDLLELSRVGRTRNRLAHVDLQALVQEVLESHAVMLEQQQVQVRVGQDLPTIEADRRRLYQVLDNLIGNALKYGASPADGRTVIDIDVACIGAGSGGAFDDASGGEEREVAIISVADHGPGVPEAFREQVFGLFQRLRRDQPGTGVGLALVRRIAAAHGGKAWVEDRPGGGARFLIALPMTAPDEAVPLNLPVPRLESEASTEATARPSGDATDQAGELLP